MTIQKKWWKRHYRDAQRTRGKAEGLGVREEMARQYFEDGKYSDASAMWDEMADIADKYPSTEREAPKYRQMAKKIKDKADSQRKSMKGIDTTHFSLNGILAIAGLVLGIFFLSSNLTGNAIANLSTSTTSFISAGFFIVSLIAGFFWLRSRKH